MRKPKITIKPKGSFKDFSKNTETRKHPANKLMWQIPPFRLSAHHFTFAKS